MINRISYNTYEADGGIIYFNGLTNEKDQRIRIIDWNHVSLDFKKIQILEERPEDENDKKVQEAEAIKIARGVADEFNAWARRNPKVKNKFMGVVLSFTPDEREKIENDPQLQEEIIHEYLHQMGFDDAQFFAVYHYDTAAPHIHLYINMVGADCKPFDSYQSKKRGQKACRAIEKKHGLAIGKGINKNYTVDRNKTNPKNQRRIGIQTAIKSCLKDGIIKYIDFKDALLKQGISVTIVEVVKGNKRTRGIVFEKDHFSFAGKSIGNDMTYPQLVKHFTEGNSLQVDKTLVIETNSKEDGLREKVRKDIEKITEQILHKYAAGQSFLKWELARYGIKLQEITFSNHTKGFIFIKDGEKFTGGEISRNYTYKNLSRRFEDAFLRINSELSKLGVVWNRIDDFGIKYDIKLDKVSTEKGIYALAQANGRFYISEKPYNETTFGSCIWKDASGRTYTSYELAGLTKPQISKNGQIQAKPAKHASTSSAVIQGRETVLIVPKAAVPIAEHTTRDNKSAANSGDGLDEFEEVEDPNTGEKKKIKKTKKGISL